MLASIIITNFNYARYLRDSIDCALDQTYPYVEVIVVDDGSTDDSRNIIDSYGNRVVPVYKANGGQASAFNAGYARSGGSIILFLDADDVLDPVALERAIPLFDSDDIAKVHWPIREVTSSGMGTGGLIPADPLPDGELREGLILNGPDAYPNALLHGNAFSRRALDRCFPMPEDFRNHADVYPVTMASIFGRTRVIQHPLGSYRLHGANTYACLTVSEKNRRNLAVYALRCGTLADGLRQTGVTVDTNQWRDGHPWYDWMRDLDSAVTQLENTICPGSSFILVDDSTWSDGWYQTEILPDRHARPFLEQQGSYWGPPTDDRQAIAELERMRGEGSRFFVVAWSSFWWLDHYAGLREHLAKNYRCVISNRQLVAFDLADASY